MTNKTIFSLVIGCILFTTSCIEDNKNNKCTLQSTFTIAHTSNTSVLYNDGGITIYPSAAGLAALSDNNFMNVKRALLLVSYDEDNVIDNTFPNVTIKEADIVEGTAIPTRNVLQKNDAERLNQLDPDSIFAIDNLTPSTDIWFYRGYMNISFVTSYYSKNNKNVIPTMNVIFEQDEKDPRKAGLTLILNKHADYRSDAIVGSARIVNSIDITSLKNYFPPAGIDSVMFNINYRIASGETSVERKVSLNDFYYPYK